MSADILPPGVSVLLVRLAIIKEREARDYRRTGYLAHARACEREAQQCRDILMAHDEALQERARIAETQLCLPVDLRRALA